MFNQPERDNYMATTQDHQGGYSDPATPPYVGTCPAITGTNGRSEFQ